MGGITLDEFTQSIAYKEIFGQGRLEGRQEGELEIALRQLRRRCGSLSNRQVDRVRGLPQQQLEELAEALLDFRDGRDLEARLQGLGG